MSIETIISAARQRVLNRVSAIVADGRSQAAAVRRELIVETAGRGGDMQNALADLIKAARVAQEERGETLIPFYAMVEEELARAQANIGRRTLELATSREAQLKGEVA